jgi:hypothetical protein
MFSFQHLSDLKFLGTLGALQVNIGKFLEFAGIFAGDLELPLLSYLLALFQYRHLIASVNSGHLEAIGPAHQPPLSASDITPAGYLLCQRRYRPKQKRDDDHD